MNSFEIQLLTLDSSEYLPLLSKNVIEGNYHGVLTSDFGKAICSSLSTNDLTLGKCIMDMNLNDTNAQMDLLSVGLTFLHMFIQNNWTGPPFKEHLYTYFANLKMEDYDDVSESCLKLLTSNEESPYHLTPYPLLLLLAKRILVDILPSRTSSTFKYISWWTFRTLFIHQRILENPSQDIMDDCESILNDLKRAIEDDNKDKEQETNKNIIAAFYLEAGLFYQWHRQDSVAMKHFKLAQDFHGFKFRLTGALGKRTKFQTFDVTQLVVVAENVNDTQDKSEDVMDNSDDNQDSEAKKVLPETLALNDDTLLEKIELTEKNNQQLKKLKPFDQCILLAFCLNVKNTNPVHGLTTEEMVPYVQRVLEDPNNWMVHTMGLLLRSRLESHKSRTVERAVLQLQALVDQLPLEEASIKEKMTCIFSILIPPKWELEKELGEKFVSIGVVLSALDIFKRLEMWEECISCLQMANKLKQAEDMVLEQLEKKPKSPKFLCILADLRHDPELYKQAWESSNHRYARAMRSLGAHYFRKGEYPQAIECYEKALSINPLYDNSWFVLGCAAMRCEQWDTSISAFGRVVSLDHENGEAWTNMASIYIRQKKIRDAWRALREALKHMFDNYKVWQNYLYCCVDLYEFSDCIVSLQRLVELRADKVSNKESIVDMEILHILVDSVLRGEKDAEGQSATRLLKKLTQLMNLIESKMSNSEAFYKISSRFYMHQKKYRKSLEYSQKRYRLLLHQPNMEVEEEKFKNTVEAALDLVDSYENLGPQTEESRMGGGVETVCKDWLYQSKMILKTLIGRTKDNWVMHEIHQKLVEKLQEVNQLGLK